LLREPRLRKIATATRWCSRLPPIMWWAISRPSSRHVGKVWLRYVDTLATPETHRRRLAVEAAARDLGVTLIRAGVDTPEDGALDSRFRAFPRWRRASKTHASGPGFTFAAHASMALK